MTDLVRRLRDAWGDCHCGTAPLLEAAAEIERLRAERDERSTEIARLLMKIDRLHKDKLAWQNVAKDYGNAIDRLRQILPPD